MGKKTNADVKAEAEQELLAEQAATQEAVDAAVSEAEDGVQAKIDAAVDAALLQYQVDHPDQPPLPPATVEGIKSKAKAKGGRKFRNRKRAAGQPVKGDDMGTLSPVGWAVAGAAVGGLAAGMLGRSMGLGALLGGGAAYGWQMYSGKEPM